ASDDSPRIASAHVFASLIAGASRRPRRRPSARRSVRLFGEDGIDAAAPAAAIGVEQDFGRGAAALGDLDERVEEMRFVRVAHPVETTARA
ncbi:MAG: hypothetical protein ACK56I_08060, partial [bacterium]